MYSLASELGRDDNDLLWLTIIGVSAAESYGRTASGLSIATVEGDRQQAPAGWHASRGARIKALLRDEVRRLNPPELTETGREVLRGHAGDAIPAHAKSPTDNSIVLSPEPRFLLVRHWSLYDSMLHSPYLSAKLHVWSDAGRRRLHKLLAKMGISLVQCKQSYTHMDMDLKKVLRERLLQVAPQYGLDDLVPPATNDRSNRDGWGFVRSWGWKACLSAADVASIISAVLEVGHSQLATLPHSTASQPSVNPIQPNPSPSEEALTRFYTAYDALLHPQRLLSAIPLTQSLHRAILRTGTSILQKRQIKHLRAFRMALLKEGPDLALFTAPGALIALALWLGEAVAEVEPEKRTESKRALTPLVLGCLDEARELYVVVGLGGGAPRSNPHAAAERKKVREERRAAREAERSERAAARDARRAERAAARAGADEDEEEDETEEEGSESESESDDATEDEAVEDGSRRNRNRFGVAFGEVAETTRARVRQDCFEHAVIEVRKEDLSGFLERLSSKAVVG